MSLMNKNSKTRLIFKLLIPIQLVYLLIALPPIIIECQKQQANATTITLSNTNASASNNSDDFRISDLSAARAGGSRQDRSEPLAPNTTTATESPTSEVLLSANKFVDFTEASTILFDGISNENENDTDTRATASAKPETTANNSSNSSLAAASSNPEVVGVGRGANATSSAAPSSTNATLTTTTTLSPPTTTVPIYSDAPSSVAVIRDGRGEEAMLGGGENEDDESDDKSESESAATDQEDDEPIESDFHDSSPTFNAPQNVSQYMDYIERLVHDFRHEITDLFEPHIPKWIRTSQMVQLSSSCSYDLLRLALAIRKFEPWALRMLDSSGKVPEGILEGSFTALGSYDECLSIVFEPTGSVQTGHSSGPSSSSQQQQHSHRPTQGKYCLVNVSPFLPPKPPADKVERMFQEEANRRNYTKDDQFSRLSPMFYYMTFRIGVCIPSTCLDADMEAVSSAVSSTLRLNITIPHCRVKQEHQLTGHELAGGIVFGLVLATVLAATILDCSRRKLARMRHEGDDLVALKLASLVEEQAGNCGATNSIGRALTSGCCLDKMNNKSSLTIDSGHLSHSLNWLPPAGANLSAERTVSGSGSSSGNDAGIKEFARHHLDEHWSWRSFSLLTNYKLYFEHKSATLIKRPSNYLDDDNRGHQAATSKQQQETLSLPLSSPATDRVMLVRCLNGIRVLSLCWVIVANSYITLDPRATKRLTKTLDAPKDFLFQMIVQASLAIETFFFLSGALMSMSFARRLKPAPTATTGSSEEALLESINAGFYNQRQKCQRQQDEITVPTKVSVLLRWIQFYVHRFIRTTPATMLVIAFVMFGYSYGDGPLWFEATHKAHLSCSQNWWRHLLHVANFIDTRQMCFIHYWYISADMQLFLFAPILLFLIYKQPKLGYAIAILIGLSSIGSVFYTTYTRSLPPTLLFYSSDPESRQEFGNTIMTKPLTHTLPYLVGMLVGKWLASNRSHLTNNDTHHHHHHRHQQQQQQQQQHQRQQQSDQGNWVSKRSMVTLCSLLAIVVALCEVFLPYKWNNSHLPTRFLAALYAALFRFAWSLVLACLVISCRHRRTHKCAQVELIKRKQQAGCRSSASRLAGCCCSCSNQQAAPDQVLLAPSEKGCCHQLTMMVMTAVNNEVRIVAGADALQPQLATTTTTTTNTTATAATLWCFCGSGGNLVNRFLSLNIFTHLSKLSFVAYLIHLPLMSVFIAQTRGLFAFSHALVTHLALSYLVMTFVLSFVLVHIIEFPFITFEVHLFEKLLCTLRSRRSSSSN